MNPPNKKSGDIRTKAMEMLLQGSETWRIRKRLGVSREWLWDFKRKHPLFFWNSKKKDKPNA